MTLDHNIKLYMGGKAFSVLKEFESTCSTLIAHLNIVER